jgi:hypothetical protein
MGQRKNKQDGRFKSNHSDNYIKNISSKQSTQKRLFSWIKCKNQYKDTDGQWLTSVLLATQETEIRRIMV